MDKASVRALKTAWKLYQEKPDKINRDNFLRQMEYHHSSVFSCLELYSR